jgi:hypothetical protein
MKHRVAIPAAVSLALFITPTSAAQIDLRECPLDTTVFIDPWAGGTFTVSRVGTDYGYLCDDGIEPPNELCQGPFGDMVLDGELVEGDGASQQKYAIYTVIKGAPCCDWNVTDPADTVFGERFKWLEPTEVPLLGEQGFLSIESEHGEDFGNPMTAVACTLRN